MAGIKNTLISSRLMQTLIFFKGLLMIIAEFFVIYPLIGYFKIPHNCPSFIQFRNPIFLTMIFILQFY